MNLPDAVVGFIRLVSAYLAGSADWESVHRYAVELEYQNKATFPHELPALEELHTIFLTADSKDDPQFRADRQEIAQLLSEVDRQA